MEMGMMVELLAPGVEHGKAPNLCTQMLRVPSDILECLRHGTQEQPVEEAGVLQRERPEVVWESKNHMAVGGLKEFLLAGGKPRGLRRAMTFGTATVAAGVVGLDLVATLVTLGDVAPERRCPTHRDGAQRPVLRA